ncbi:sugar-binding domain-containing protein [Planctomycetota bacterium]
MHKTQSVQRVQTGIGFVAALVVAALGASAGTPRCMADEKEPHALQGYGRVSLEVADTGDGPAVFRCENDTAADRLLSKLLADFSWDRLTGPRQQTLADGVSALKVQPHGLLLFARQGSTVYALCGESPEALDRQRTRLGLDLQRTRFKAQRRHPLSLDFFDLHAVSMYYQPLNVLDLAKGPHRHGAGALGQTSAFWRESGYGHSFFGPYFGLDELADGAEHFFPHQWMIRQAVANDAVVMSHLGQYAAPWWMRNRFARDIVQWDPYAISGWNGLSAMAGTHLSQHASDEAYAYTQRFARQALESVKTTAGDHLGCFREVAGGHPGDELALHHASTELMDYDEAGQKAFRRWLQESRGLDLASLGRRWFNDPGRYRSWDEVTLPSHYEFYGRFDDGSLNLLTDWSWRPDHPQAEAEGWPRPDYREDDSWTPTDLAPSMSQLFLFGSKSDARLRQGKSRVAWFRKAFDPTAWLAQQPDGEVYLVANVGDRKNEPVEVFLNGDYLGPIRPRTVQSGPVAFRATELVSPGQNVLCLKVKNGIIRGPVFLTRHEPRRYPYLGTQQNARWVDLRDWTAEKLVLGWKRGARAARQAAPDVPLLFCPGSSLALSDQFLGLKRELGIEAIHHTGGGSSYMPWWPGIGYVWGAYGTSEEGGTITDPHALDNELAWMLLNGQGHHNYYYSAIHYMRLEEETGWFSRNRRLLELIGKASWSRPSVAVFRSARNELYFPESESYNGSDPGRGMLQGAHYANVYLTEAEIGAGLVRDYPVVIDAGNAVIDNATLDALSGYVRGGGTLVAVENTGRHGLLEPDAWPIARLTGMRVRGTRENMRLEIPADSTHLPHLAGATFQASGVAMEPDEVAGSNARPEILARWSDGAAAAAMRRLGRGRVVVLGSSFWRSGTDRTGDGRQLEQSLQTTLLTDLLTGLGVRRLVDASSEDVWVRRLVTKNGLQQWVVAYNAGRGTVEDLTIRIPWAQSPRRVLDVVSGQAVEFNWDGGEIRISGLALPRSAVRVLAVENAKPLEAVAHWFSEKCRYEERAPEIKPAKEPAPPPATAIVFRDFQFRRAEDDARQDLAWLDEPTDRAPWQPQGYGFWDEQGQPAQGVGVYRQTFRLPDAWHGRRVLLACMSFDYPVFLEQAEFYINGRAAGQYHGHAWASFDVLDVTPHLQPGENRLAVRVEAEQVRGGYLGQLVIYPLEKFEDSRDLREGWRLYDDNRTYRSATLPLQAAGRHLEIDVALPADWQSKDIYLEFEVADRWVGILTVNGRVISYNQSLHPYPNIMQVNLYPWAKPGETNRIELWPRTPEDTPSLKMVVQRVRIGTVEPSGAPGGPAVATVSRAVRGSPALASGVTDKPQESGRPAVGAIGDVGKPARSATPAPPGKPGPPVLKDGFEQWSPLSPERQREAMVQNVVLTADRLAPEGWTPGRELGGQKELTGKILPDTAVKHSGQYSARLENADPRDITVLQYSTERAEARGTPAILPNRRYVVRWWVKGERVENADAGPILMMSVVSTKQGQTYRTYASESWPLPKGAFDWQQRQLTFITDAHARSAMFSFQLRWATGIVWYDDVELQDIGPVVPVDTY